MQTDLINLDIITDRATSTVLAAYDTLTWSTAERHNRRVKVRRLVQVAVEAVERAAEAQVAIPEDDTFHGAVVAHARMTTVLASERLVDALTEAIGPLDPTQMYAAEAAVAWAAADAYRMHQDRRADIVMA